MAHVLDGVYDVAMRTMVAEMLEIEGHRVTVASDFWGGLGVLRSALHPVIGIYAGDVWLNPLQEEHLAALEANLETLRQHAYLQITWLAGPLPKRLERLERVAAQLHIETISPPFPVETLLQAVTRAAAHLGKPGRRTSQD